MKQPKPRYRQHRVLLSEKSRMYRQLWRIVDGAVFDALYTHGDYLTAKGRFSARTSINKRVVGAIIGFVEQSTEGRSVARTAAARVTALRTTPSSRVSVSALMSKARAGLLRAARALGISRNSRASETGR